MSKEILELFKMADRLCDKSIQIDEKAPYLGKWYLCMKYPFHKLQVGHSFVLEGLTENQITHIICSAKALYGKKLNHKYARKKEGDGIRIWRIE